MLEEDFQKLYENFRMRFYKKLFEKSKEKKVALTANDMFCAETIYLLKKPTFSEFAEFIGESKSNVNYKIKRLIEKGYVSKSNSSEDKREYHLSVTDKFINYYLLEDSAPKEFVSKVRKEFKQSEIEVLESYLSKLTKIMED